MGQNEIFLLKGSNKPKLRHEVQQFPFSNTVTLYVQYITAQLSKLFALLMRSDDLQWLNIPLRNRTHIYRVTREASVVLQDWNVSTNFTETRQYQILCKSTTCQQQQV
jgi:hypothetical protein